MIFKNKLTDRSQKNTSANLKLNKKVIIIWILVLLFLGYGYKTVPPRYSFANDSLIKLLQAKSLSNNHFHSDEYTHFLKEYDSSFTYFPIDYQLYHLKVNGKHIGPFPVLLSFIGAVLLSASGHIILPLFSGIVYILSLVVLKKFWNVHVLSILHTAVCTSLIIYALEFSENILFIFLHFLSVSLFFKWGEKKLAPVISGFLLGLSVWLRLESIVFLPIFVVSYLVVYREKKENYLPILLYSLFFVLVFLVFLVFNFFAYGNVIGPRFLADQENFFLNFSHKISIYISLYFGKSEEVFFKVGFFGLTPIFLFVLFWSISVWKDTLPELKTLYLATVLYILISPGLAPHDGVWSWGARYLSMCILPISLFLDTFIKVVIERKQKIYIGLFVLLSIYSLTQTLLGIKIVSLSAGVMKIVQAETEKIDSDIRLFHNGILALHTGPQILDKPSLLASDEKQLHDLLKILKTHYQGKTIAYSFSEKLDSVLKEKVNYPAASSQSYKSILSKELQEIKILPSRGLYTETYYYKISEYSY
jgi:hypothetical protein